MVAIMCMLQITIPTKLLLSILSLDIKMGKKDKSTLALYRLIPKEKITAKEDLRPLQHHVKM